MQYINPKNLKVKIKTHKATDGFKIYQRVHLLIKLYLLISLTARLSLMRQSLSEHRTVEQTP